MLLNPCWLVTLLASEEQRATVLFSFSAAKCQLMFPHHAPNTVTTSRHLSPQQQRGQCLYGAILKGSYLAKVFSMLARAGEDTGCVSYRDDMNLLGWTAPGSPQARHCNRGLFTSNPPLLSTTLSILCVCLLLYLLTVLNKPRRNAQAAIFPVLARSQTRINSRVVMLPSGTDSRLVFTITECLTKDKLAFTS